MINVSLMGNGLRLLNLRWYPPTQKEWAPILLKDQKVPWQQQSDPTTGRPWARLSPNYARKKAKKYPGQPILRATGTMQDGAKITPWQTGFNVLATFYGAYHQFGTSKMPARPWVGIPDKSLIQICPIAWKNILSRPR
jgi:hypothetical protein